MHIPDWHGRLKSIKCQERSYVYTKKHGVKYKAKIGKQCGRSTVIGTMICWQHLRHNLFITDSNITQRVGRRDVPIGKGLFTLIDEENPNSIIFREGEAILYYYGFPLTDQKYDQKYGVFTATYTVGPKSSCNANFEARYPPENHTGPFKYAIVASKNIKGGREMYVNYGRTNRINNLAQPFMLPN